MPAKDKYHDAVLNALRKDAWQIVREQARLSIGKRQLWVDLKLEKDNQVIYVETKGFETDYSIVEYLSSRLGQYVMYRATLEALKLNFPIYLAIPKEAFDSIFQECLAKAMGKHLSIKLIIIDIDHEEIEQWIIW